MKCLIIFQQYVLNYIKKVQNFVTCFLSASFESILLLLSCDTLEVKPYIGFKAKGVLYSWKRDPFFTMAGVRFLPLYDRWQHHPSPQLWYSLKGREIFSRNNRYGKVLSTDNGTFGTTDFTSTYTACTQWIFGNIWNRNRALRSEALRHNL